MKKSLVTLAVITLVSIQLIGQVTNYEVGVFKLTDSNPFATTMISSANLACFGASIPPVADGGINPNVIAWTDSVSALNCNADITSFLNSLPISIDPYTIRVRINDGVTPGPWSLSSNTFLRSGQQDVEAPAVAITNIRRSGNSPNYSVTVNITDNIGIEEVKYYVDGNNQVTLSAPPWNASIRITMMGSHTVTVYAKDFAGNMGSASRTVVR